MKHSLATAARGRHGSVRWGLFSSLLAALVLGIAASAQAATDAELTTAAVQKSVDYLTRDAATWTQQNNCSACHRQGAAMYGLAAAKANGYQVVLDDPASVLDLTYLAQRTVQYQETSGAWTLGGGAPVATSSWAFFGLAGFDQNANTSQSSALVKAADWAVRTQQASDGAWVFDFSHFPINSGRVADAARMVVGIVQAKQRVDPAKASTYETAINKVVAYLKARSNDVSSGVDGTGQTHLAAWALIGLKAGGVPDSDEAVTRLATRLLANTSASTGRGWGYTRDWAADEFNTGMALYALARAGYKLSDARLMDAVTWLRSRQRSDGAWASPSFGSIDVPTTFAILGLSSFGTYSVNVAVNGPDKRVLGSNRDVEQTATYTFDVTNNGSFGASDTYTLSVAGGLPDWAATLDRTSLTLGANETGQVVLTVEAPPLLLEALRVEMTLTATSQGNPKVSSSARVITYTDPPPPSSGNATRTELLSGTGTITVGQVKDLSARVFDAVTGQQLVGPQKGVVTFFVGGAAVGTDADRDSDGVFTVAWRPDFTWNALGTQDFRAIYSGIDLAAPATDLLSSLAATTVTLVKPADVVPPSVSLEALPPYTAQRQRVVRGTAQDTSGIRSVRLTVNGVEVTDLTGPDATGAVTANVVLAEGANTLVLAATDTLGNTGATTAETTLDTIAPAITITTPTADAVLGSSTVAFSAEVRDQTPTSGDVMGSPFTFPSGTGTAAAVLSVPGEGRNVLRITARDAAGNETSVPVSVLLDFSAPVLDIDVAQGQAFGPASGGLVPYTLHVDDLSATTVHTASGETLPLERGGGVIHGVAALVPGYNELVLTVTDETGRTTSLSRTVVYDVEPPVGAVLVPEADAQVRGALELSASATDALTGVALVSFSLDGADPTPAAPTDALWMAPLDTRLLSDGRHALTAAFVDLLGNTRTETVPFTVDNTAPTVSLSAPAEGAYLRGSVLVSASAADETTGVSAITLKVGSAVVASCTGASPCSVTFDTTTLPDGPFVITAEAVDAVGNEATPATVSVVADNTAPARFLVSPMSGATVTTSMQVAVDVKDVNFASVECSVDGVSLGASTSPTFSQTVDLLGTLDGEHTVRCVATDLAGNTGSEEATVRVHNWELELNPQTLNLKGNGSGVVTLYVEGVNVSLLVPIEARSLSLVVPGGAPVPALLHPASAGVGDQDGDGTSDLTLKFDRPALQASIKAGIAANAIDPRTRLEVRLFAGDHAIGSASIAVKQ